MPFFENSGSGSRHTVLCLGAHADDIEIGCGGTLLRLLNTYPNMEVVWVVFSANRKRRKEAMESATRFLAGASRKTVIVRSFRESFFPYRGEAIKGYFEQLKKTCNPDLVFTHYRYDLHQDHRVINQFTWNTFRNHHILEYEIPKYDGDMGVPNMFVPLTIELAKKKTEYLIKGFPSQQGKQWFTEDTFLALLRLRGIEASGGGRYAEAFYSRKWVIE